VRASAWERSVGTGRAGSVGAPCCLSERVGCTNGIPRFFSSAAGPAPVGNAQGAAVPPDAASPDSSSAKKGGLVRDTLWAIGLNCRVVHQVLVLLAMRGTFKIFTLGCVSLMCWIEESRDPMFAPFCAEYRLLLALWGAR
jgi:hypothetical protein